MAWTETRSRDEWLAEVRRRGERIRRRRRLTITLVGVLALAVPASALATFLRDDPGRRDVELEVAGPPAPGPVGGMTLGAPGLTGPSEPEPTPATPVVTSTTMFEPQLRVEASRGGSSSASPTSVPSASSALTDDPVVRTTTTIALLLNSDSPPQSAGGPVGMASAASAFAQPALAPCVAADVRLTVSVDRTSYAPGETVYGSSTLDKVTPGTCDLPSWGLRVTVVDSAGKDLSGGVTQSWTYASIDDQAEKWSCDASACRRPVDPGRIFTRTFEWQAIDCSRLPGPLVPTPGTPCPPFPSGTYTVAAEWFGPGSGPSDRMTFQLGA